MNIFRVGVFNGMAVIVRAVVGLTLTKLSAAVLGPAGFVVLANVQTVTTLWLGLSNGTFYNSVTRFLAEPGGEALTRKVISTTTTMALGLGCILAPLLWVISRSIIGETLAEQTVHYLCWAVALSCPLVAVGSVLNGYFNGLQKLGLLVAGNILASLISLMAALFLIHWYGANGALYSVIAASTAVFLGYFVILLTSKSYRGFDDWWSSIDLETARAILPYSSMALASAIAAPLTLYVIRKTLVDDSGAIEAGKWQAIWRLSELYIAPLTATFSVYFLPKFASLVDVANLRRELTRCAWMVLAVMFLLATVVLTWRQDLIHLLLGKSFAGAESLIPLQLVGDTLKLVSWMFGFLFLAKGATRQYIAGEILFMLVFIGATKLLVPFQGVRAAVIAYIISYAIYLTYCIFASKYKKYL